MTACPGGGERGEQDSRNNRLRPEKFLWMRFRTGVQLSPPPPCRSKRFNACSDLFYQSARALILMLLRSKSQPLALGCDLDVGTNLGYILKIVYALLKERHLQKADAFLLGYSRSLGGCTLR